MLVLFIGIVMLLYCEKVVLNCNCKDLIFVFIIAPAMQSLTVVEQQKHTIITILV
jgi:hypothetical protein